MCISHVYNGYGLSGKRQVFDERSTVMNSILQTIMAALGAFGFALIFNIHGKKLIIPAIGGALTWGSYLIMYNISGEMFTSCLVATVMSMIFAEIMARIAKTPVVILLVPMLIPMIPGGDLYRMMAGLVLSDSKEASLYGQQLLMEVGGIVFGIILVSTAMQVAHRVHDLVSAGQD